MNLKKTLENIVPITLAVGLFAVVALVLPFFENFIVFSKVSWSILLALVVVVLFLANYLVSGAFKLKVNLANLGLAGLGLMAFISTITFSQYSASELIGLSGVYVAAGSIALLASSLYPKRKISSFVLALEVSALVTAILLILQLLGGAVSGIYQVFLPQIELPQSAIFQLIGSPFIAAQLLLVSTIVLARENWKLKELNPLKLGSLAVIIGGLIISVWLVLPGKDASPVRLPAALGWGIALETLKIPQFAAIGIGPNNFDVLYMANRPAWVNTTTLSNVTFTQSTNTPLTILSTLGIPGILFWMLLGAGLVRHLIITFKNESSSPTPALVGAGIFALGLLFPPNIPLLILLAVSVAASTSQISQKSFKFSLLVTDSSQVANMVSKGIGVLVGAAIIIVSGYGLARAGLASNYKLRSVSAFTANDISRGYDLQARTVLLAPYNDSYRRAFAVTNLQIATALSNKADITEAEQEQVLGLIRTAITHAQASTVLNPADSQNWQSLALVYRNLIGVVTDAEQWTIDAYVQAISTDPSNPVLRMELGSVFYNAENYQQAIAFFEQAANLRPDFVSAYYNAANALVELEQYQVAHNAYQQTLLLLEPDSAEYLQVNEEFSQLKETMEELGITDQTAGDQQSTPQSEVGSIVEQQVNQQPGDLLTPPSISPDINLEGISPLQSELLNSNQQIPVGSSAGEAVEIQE